MALLTGKNIFVTGGSRGIGSGIVRVLCEHGATVGFSYTSRPELAEKLLAELPGTGHFTVKMNQSNGADVEAAFAQVFTRFENLHGLVNNAGITRDNLMLRMKSEEFDDVINTNLRGTFLCIKEVIKPMLKARSGSVVNVPSVVGQSGNPGQANYTASKAGVEAMSKSLAQELASRNIRFNCVAPGFIETEMTEVLTEPQRAAILSRVPLKAMGKVTDVANAVKFLLSDESSYITGQTISVNGGLYM